MKIILLSLFLFHSFSLHALGNKDFVIQDNVLVRYEGNEEHVIIPANLGINEIGNEAFVHRRNGYITQNSVLKSVSIPIGVTIIGNRAFNNCLRLENIIIPSSVITIGEAVFAGCSSLESITIPENVIFIGKNQFNSCNKLRSIYVNERNVMFTDLNGILFNKDMTTLIRYPSGKSGNDFYIPSSVTSIGDFAFLASSLERITIPESVTCIGKGAFELTKIRSIIIPSGVTVIKELTFAACFYLENIIIPEGITSIERWAFFGSTGLINITIPSSVTSIGEEVFIWEDQLTDRMNLINITVAKENETYSSVDGILFNKDRTVLLQYPAGREESSYTIPSSVTNIAYKAFFGSKIGRITVPSAITEIEERAFEKCYDLRIVVVSRNTIIGRYAFPRNTEIILRD